LRRARDGFPAETNPTLRFSAQKPPIFAQNGTRESPLIMFGRRKLIMLALGAAAQAHAAGNY
jgi:hypothetical protein